MPISSMTGFARQEGQSGDWTWAWEAKSVNSKGLDLRTRLPYSVDRLDPAVREAVGKRFKRGAVNVALTLDRGQATPRLAINEAALEQVLALQAQLGSKVDPSPPRLDTLLGIRGLVETSDEEDDPAAIEARDAALLDGLGQVLASLEAARGAEGARLAPTLDALLADIERLTAEAVEIAAAQPEKLADRLKAQLDAILEAKPDSLPERVEQELALLATKADVREELDRLSAHIAQARELLSESGAIGRRLDFLCQEFNREANTLCSKSADVALTRIGLALKAAVEQFREQVQNIE